MTAEQTALTILFIYTIISSMMVIYVCRDARKRIRESHADFPEAQKIKEIAESAKEWFGTSQELGKDGSVILYIHDKPKLKDSRKVWMTDSCGLAFSDDGGKTYRLTIPDDSDKYWVRAGDVEWKGLKEGE